jgi:glycosyltransferase involved in cell wall biosynthesis
VTTSRHAPDERRLTVVASDVAPIGGMERVAFEVCSRLLDRGWRVTVIARTCALPTHERLRFVRIPTPPRPVSIALVGDILFGSIALHRHRSGLVQTNNPVLLSGVDVIHAHFCEAAYRRQVGVSRSRSSTALFRLNSWLASAIALLCERWCYRPQNVRRVVCPSRGLEREISQFYPRVGDLLHTIANGVDGEAFRRQDGERQKVRAELGLAAEDLLALFVGGDWHRKGLRYAVEALADAPRWKLGVVGAGDSPAFLESAQALGVEDRLMFLGSHRVVAPYYGAADAFVLPSRYETFGLVGLEAAAAGLPLIMPRLSGTEDYVQHGINGWLTARDGAAIAARLRDLEDPDRRAAMSEAAVRSAQGFEWSRIVDQWEALYSELIEAGEGT